MSDLEPSLLPVGDLTFTVRTAGPDDGEPVILLHGFPQTSWSWRNQIPRLAAAGYRVVAPDQRGYSPGARPPDVAGYSMVHLSGDVVALADTLGFDRFHLVGHDWGGAISWNVATHHPERLRSLTVLSTPHPGAFAKAIAESDQGEKSGYMELFSQPDIAEQMMADDAAMLKFVYGATGLTDEEAQPYLDALGTLDAVRAIFSWYAAGPARTEVQVSPITTPTLFVWGADDPVLGRYAAERTGEFVDAPYRFVPLEGVGHWIAEHAADRFDPLLLEHLASAPRP